MDPSQYYGYDHSSRSRSLASTTDSSRYIQSGPHYSDGASYPTHYSHHTEHPRLDYVPEGFTSNYQSAISVASSASYPGGVAQQHGSRPQSMVTGSRSVSNPIPQSYSAYAPLPSAYPAHPSPEPYARHHHPSAQGGVSYGNESPTMQHASYSSYPHSSLHSSPHPRRTHPAASPVAIPPASPTGIERYPCDRCDKTFSRAHDRKRHFETHHSAQPASHKCPFCKKDFSRADSLKRHCDNGCDKDPNREAS